MFVASSLFAASVAILAEATGVDQEPVAPVGSRDVIYVQNGLGMFGQSANPPVQRKQDTMSLILAVAVVAVSAATAFFFFKALKSSEYWATFSADNQRVSSVSYPFDRLSDIVSYPSEDRPCPRCY
ncbi:uncharacterized protein EMH_0061800 [Eimeria mitis]|uniref:Transmembrane protein n=1 Tax=Eimeria mitis TaxID=44415 RepID=U6K5V9_9EIME|nr:uncharacterized protein EMH_0061800 [Eimeria mitis]CDJ30853.1 hypothetical protein EMH_0061800 [Eimeria mitis]